MQTAERRRRRRRPDCRHRVTLGAEITPAPLSGCPALTDDSTRWSCQDREHCSVAGAERRRSQAAATAGRSPRTPLTPSSCVSRSRSGHTWELGRSSAACVCIPRTGHALNVCSPTSATQKRRRQLTRTSWLSAEDFPEIAPTMKNTPFVRWRLSSHELSRLSASGFFTCGRFILHHCSDVT